MQRYFALISITFRKLHATLIFSCEMFERIEGKERARPKIDSAKVSFGKLIAITVCFLIFLRPGPKSQFIHCGIVIFPESCVNDQ